MAWVPIVASLVGGAASGAAGGKKGGAGDNPAANTQARLAAQLFGETDPIRQALIGRSANFLGMPSGGGNIYGAAPSATPSNNPYGIPALGIAPNYYGPSPASAAPGGTPTSITPSLHPFDVTASPEYVALMDATNRQFSRAKDASIASTPTGGALTEALVGLEGTRAGTLAQGAGQAYGDEISRAMTLATGQTQPALGGLGQAAQAQGLSAQAAAAQNAAKGQTLGEGLGSYMGHKSGSTAAGGPG